MWRFSEKKRASVLAVKAHRMSPDDGWILATVGDCYLEQDEPKKAVACYERSIAVAPTEANGYTGMGDRHEYAKQFDQAEHWYREAMARAGGDSGGYERMIRMLAHHSDVMNNGAQIQELLERRNAVDPEGEYDIFLVTAQPGSRMDCPRRVWRMA
jgi:predicted Zn-dependent protease